MPSPQLTSFTSDQLIFDLAKIGYNGATRAFTRMPGAKSLRSTRSSS